MLCLLSASLNIISLSCYACPVNLFDVGLQLLVPPVGAGPRPVPVLPQLSQLPPVLLPLPQLRPLARQVGDAVGRHGLPPPHRGVWSRAV